MKTVVQNVITASTKTNPGRVDYCLQNVDIPELTQGQVLVKVKACGLPPQSQRVYENIFTDGRKSYPCGQDVSGVVTQIGPGVTNVSDGDSVVGILPLDSPCSGCSEFCVLNEYDLVKKPNMLGFEEAAGGIGDCIRAYTALHYQARVCAGDTVLILDGASTFGMVAIQLARLWGAKVITVVGSAAEKSLLEGSLPSFGQIIEMGQRTNILVSSVMEETGGLGVDVIIDSGVKMYTNEEDSQLLSERRKFPTPHKHDVISCLGVAGKWVTQQMDLQLDPPDSHLLYMRGASLCYLFGDAWTLSYTQQGRYQHILHDAMEKLDRGNIKCKISKKVPIDELVEELTNQNEERNGKVVMVTS